jgi:hypothetical protein
MMIRLELDDNDVDILLGALSRFQVELIKSGYVAEAVPVADLEKRVISLYEE